MYGLHPGVFPDIRGFKTVSGRTGIGRWTENFDGLVVESPSPRNDLWIGLLASELTKRHTKCWGELRGVHTRTRTETSFRVYVR